MQISNLVINIERSTMNSLYLSSYMLLCLGSQLKALGIGGIICYYLLLIIPFLLVFKKHMHIYFLSIVVFLGACLLCGMKGFFYSNLLFIIIAPVMAYWIIYSKFNLKILILAYTIIILFFVNAAINDMNDEIMYSSRNYVSVILLFHSVLLSVIVYLQTHKTIIIPSIVTLILSIMATGRGGIVCSAIFCLSMIILKFHSISNKYLKYCILIICLSTLTSSIPFVVEYYEESEYLFRVRGGGFEDYSREKLLKEYLDNIDAITFFTGYDMKDNAVIRQFDGNPHNSYIRLHSYLGFFMLIPVVLILLSFITHIRRHEFIFVLPLLSILLRAYTDIFLLGFYDFVIMIFIIHAFQNGYSIKDK